MPGTFVAIGLNSPRISAGASGLGSNVSCCGGPPWSQRKMTFLALPKLRSSGSRSRRRRRRRPSPARARGARAPGHSGPRPARARGGGCAPPGRRPESKIRSMASSRWPGWSRRVSSPGAASVQSPVLEEAGPFDSPFDPLPPGEGARGRVRGLASAATEQPRIPHPAFGHPSSTPGEGKIDSTCTDRDVRRLVNNRSALIISPSARLARFR